MFGHSHNKGQASFEALMVTAFIFVVGIIALSQWMTIADETYAVMLTKSEVTPILHEANGNYVLTKITTTEDADTSLTVTLFITSSTLPLSSETQTAIKTTLTERITAKSKYTAINTVIEEYTP
jgi:hypothetical protein